MAAICPEWPKAKPLVAGNDVTLVVKINTTADISDYAFVAAVREYPEGPVVVRWTVEVVPADHTVICRLTKAQSRLLRSGYGTDLTQTNPIEYTWLIIESLNVQPSYSDEGA